MRKHLRNNCAIRTVLFVTLVISVTNTASAMDRWADRCADTRVESDVIDSDRSCEAPGYRPKDHETRGWLVVLLFRVWKPGGLFLGLALGAPGLAGTVDVSDVLPLLLVPMSGDPDELEPDPEP